MKKILLFVTLLVLCLALTVSCSDNSRDADDTENEALNADDTEVKAHDVSAMSKELGRLDIIVENTNREFLDNDLCDYYFSNSQLLSGVTNCIFFTSKTTALYEVGVFKSDSKEKREEIISDIEKRRENLISIYEMYSEEDTKTAKNMIIKEDGDIVYYIATPDNATIENVIVSK